MDSDSDAMSVIDASCDADDERENSKSADDEQDVAEFLFQQRHSNRYSAFLFPAALQTTTTTTTTTTKTNRKKFRPLSVSARGLTVCADVFPRWVKPLACVPRLHDRLPRERRPLLQRVSFDLRPREMMLVLGPPGALLPRPLPPRLYDVAYSLQFIPHHLRPPPHLHSFDRSVLGCGRTTLLDALACAPTGKAMHREGCVYLDGEPAERYTHKARDIAYVRQNDEHMRMCPPSPTEKKK
jgi:hypothetical protein